MTLIKICGIKTFEEAIAAQTARVWAIGQVFAPSKRRISPETAAEINARFPSLFKIGVFVNEKVEVIRDIVDFCRLDAVQLHGDEEPEIIGKLNVPVIKSFAVEAPLEPELYQQWQPWAYHFDTKSTSPIRGGTGNIFNWDYIGAMQPLVRIMLAGGLTPENVGMAVRKVKPWAVDVSSGVEFPAGGKNPAAIYEFVKQVREADLMSALDKSERRIDYEQL